MKIWELLSGSKRLIGGVITLTVGFLAIKQVIDSDTATYLLGLGGLIFGIGAWHGKMKDKAAKKIKNDK